MEYLQRNQLAASGGESWTASALAAARRNQPAFGVAATMAFGGQPARRPSALQLAKTIGGVLHRLAAFSQRRGGICGG